MSNLPTFFPISKYFSKFQNLFQTSKFFQNFKYVICQYFQFQFENHNGSHKLLGFVDAQVLCILIFNHFQISNHSQNSKFPNFSKISKFFPNFFKISQFFRNFKKYPNSQFFFFYIYNFFPNVNFFPNFWIFSESPNFQICLFYPNFQIFSPIYNKFQIAKIYPNFIPPPSISFPKFQVFPLISNFSSTFPNFIFQIFSKFNSFPKLFPNFQFFLLISNFSFFSNIQIYNCQFSISICKSQLKLKPLGIVNAQVLCIDTIYAKLGYSFY